MQVWRGNTLRAHPADAGSHVQLADASGLQIGPHRPDAGNAPHAALRTAANQKQTLKRVGPAGERGQAFLRKWADCTQTRQKKSIEFEVTDRCKNRRIRREARVVLFCTLPSVFAVDRSENPGHRARVSRPASRFVAHSARSPPRFSRFVACALRAPSAMPTMRLKRRARSIDKMVIRKKRESGFHRRRVQ